MTAAVSPSLLAPANLAAAPSTPQAHGAAFAQMLDARRAEAPHEPAPADAPEAEQPKTEDTSAADNAQATRVADEARNRQLRAQRHVATRPQGGDSTPVHEPRARAEPAEPASEKAPAKANADDAASAVDPALTDWLASLNLPPAQPVPPAAETAEATGQQLALRTDQAATADVTRAELPDTAASPEKSTPRGASPFLGGSDAARRHGPDNLKLAHGDALAELRQGPETATTFQAALAQVAALPERARAMIGEVPKGDLAAAAQAMAAVGPLTERPAAEMAAPAVVHMATPADAPDFRQALGAQLSVLVKDGVQQAELHLNPADMGPISVQIALDGDTAKVNFGADSAATRQLIESGLPELAAALRDAGFTLSGGGVHSQAQQQGQREQEGGRPGQPSDPRATTAHDVADAPRAPMRTVRVGGVDLYA